MDITISEEGNRRIVRFSNRLTINEISEIHDEIEKYMSDGMFSLLDFSSVTECDATGLQILISLLKYQNSENLNLSVSNISETINDMAGKLGIDLNEFFYSARG